MDLKGPVLSSEKVKREKRPHNIANIDVAFRPCDPHHIHVPVRVVVISCLTIVSTLLQSPQPHALQHRYITKARSNIGKPIEDQRLNDSKASNRLFGDIRSPDNDRSRLQPERSRNHKVHQHMVNKA